MADCVSSMCSLHSRDDISINENIVVMTEKQLNTAQNIAHRWLVLKDSHMSRLAESFLKLGDSKNIIVYVHKQCYSAFTNVTMLCRAEERSTKTDNSNITRRSTSRLHTTTHTNGRLWGSCCIICEKKDNWCYRNKKRVRDKLCLAETLTGGKLLEAARKHNNFRIISLVGQGDCVALEVKYHKECFKSFTRIVSEPLMSKKPKLKRPHTVVTNETESSSTSDMSDCDVSVNHCNRESSDLYYAGLALRKDIQAHDYVMPWPLPPQGINPQLHSQAVPLSLVEFIGLITGVSSYSLSPVKQSPQQIPAEMMPKVLSICEDIMYLATNGKTLTPKAVTLGLVVKHMTGSKDLVNLLNKHGHCASYDTILRYETSLAQMQLSSGLRVPSGFTKRECTVLVWDNIDFGEETLSGGGTTHHTNGVILQIENENAVVTELPSVSKPRLRTISPIIDVIDQVHIPSKCNPVHTQAMNINHSDRLQSLFKRAKCFEFLLAACQNQCKLPGWTELSHIVSANTIIPKSKLEYLPVIESPPTSLSTVNHILRRSISIADELDLDTIVVVFDQAIYSKAQQIRSVYPEMQNRLVVRMGEFHTVMTFLGVIGKRFGDAGLADILVESNVVALGSIRTVLNGHHYNRSIRAHKLTLEALHDMLFSAYIQSLDNEQAEEAVAIVTDLASAIDTGVFNDKMQSNDVQLLYRNFQTYIQTQSRELPTFQFWVSYLEMVTILLAFIRATRESNWELHLATLQEMLPYFFAYDRVNYARYGSLYFLEMSNLAISHPRVYQSFVDNRGSFTYQSHSGPFAGIACDQAIEQTVNRASKTAGGLVNISLNRSAAQRWTLAQSQRLAIVEATYRYVEVSASKSGPKSQVRERLLVSNLSETITSRINPFEHQLPHLVSLSSGVVATPEMATDLAEAHSRGQIAFLDFVQHRLLTNENQFSEPLKQMNLKTFSSNNAKKKQSAPKYLKSLFNRLLIANQHRTIDVKQALAHSLAEYSFSLGKPTGDLMKTPKNILMSVIESDVGDECLMKPASFEAGSLIVDAMACIQTLCSIPSTFNELSSLIFKQCSSLALRCKARRVHFVCDTYPTVSIKGQERLKRSKAGTQKVKISYGAQKVPLQFKMYLSDGSNKEDLLRFLMSDWSSGRINEDPGSSLQQVYFACDSTCYLIDYSMPVVTTTLIPELSSDHEEADTRMILHAKYDMMHNRESVVIRCPDTDVFVLCLYHMAINNLPECIYFATGCGSKYRVIDIRLAAMKLGETLCKSLLGLHALSGCDSTSAFYGKGKKKIYSIVKSKSQYQYALAKLGTEFSVIQCVEDIETLVCHLYGHSNLSNINEARYAAFCSSKTELLLPPTKDELDLHIKRCNYQVAIWRRGCIQFLRAPTPLDHGWCSSNNDGSLYVKWMTLEPAPSKILKTIACSCRTGCSTERCSCKKSDLVCTDLCKCQLCSNHCDKNSTSDDQESGDEEDEPEI